MSRRSLRPQLNQIRGWVRHGRTDAWIAHQLEVTVQQIQAFKRELGLEPGGEDGENPKPRRSPARGGRSRRRTAGKALEGTFDHGEEGYGLWLDPDVQDDPVYAEHWAGHRPVEVTIEEDQIVIRRAGGGDDED